MRFLSTALIPLLSAFVFLISNANTVAADLKSEEVFRYPILQVRPTQTAVGFRAIALKHDEMEEKVRTGKLDAYLRKKPIPVVYAPDGFFYQIDRHHQALAALSVGATAAYYTLIENDSRMPGMAAFWLKMKQHQWVREKDENGRPISIPEGLPLLITDARDDPYRSLAYFVRENGGFDKTDIPFAEFIWGDFFRTRIRLGTSDAEFTRAIGSAVRLAHDDSARGLPGWYRSRSRNSRSTSPRF